MVKCNTLPNNPLLAEGPPQCSTIIEVEIHRAALGRKRKQPTRCWVQSSATGQKPPYVTAFEDDKAGAYVMYCTNAVSTRRALPYLAVVRIPDRLTVRSA